MAEASRIQTTDRDAVVMFPMKWRLGYHLAAALAGALRNIEILAPDLFTLFFEGWAVAR